MPLRVMPIGSAPPITVRQWAGLVALLFALACAGGGPRVSANRAGEPGAASAGARGPSPSLPPDASPDSAPPTESATAREVSYPFQRSLPDPALPRTQRAIRYANLSQSECLRRMRGRELPFAAERRATAGIAFAVRFGAAAGPVKFLAPPRRSRFGVFDGRLGLALSELVPLLSEHEIAEVHVATLYRPRSRRSRVRRPSQHTRGLAADITGFRLRDGTMLVVERDWQGTLGDPPCGPESGLRQPSDEAVRLRNLVCAIAATQLLDTILTPNYDAAHHDHLHFDLRRGARHTILR